MPIKLETDFFATPPTPLTPARRAALAAEEAAGRGRQRQRDAL
jgi:hypothetical protein